MSAEAKKRGLGRGLDALFRDEGSAAAGATGAKAPAPSASTSAPASSVGAVGAGTAAGAEKTAPLRDADTGTKTGVRMLAVTKLQPGDFQPRRRFDAEPIAQLAESIRQHGILQPILVRPTAAGNFEIIAGERRWRAAQKAQLHEVPVIIEQLSDQQALEIALIENLQRENLTPLEEADGYQRLIAEFSYTQEQLAARLGKSRSHIANTLRLEKLPEDVKRLLQAGDLAAGHARALLGAASPSRLAQEVVRKGLNVRQTEKLVAAETEGKSGRPGPRKSRPQDGGKDVDILALEKDLTTLLGLRVTLNPRGHGGDLIISYTSLEQLDDILARLSKPSPSR